MVLAGWLFLIGGIVPLVGFFSPFAMKVYGFYARPERFDDRIAFIAANRFWWHEHNLGFAAGALVTGAAFLAQAQDGLTVAAAVAGVVGAALGATFAVQRTTASDLPTWFRGRSGSRTFGGFTVLTIVAFVLLGVHFLEDDFGAAVFLFVWNALILGVAAWFRDVPPFTHFVGGLVIGILLLV